MLRHSIVRLPAKLVLCVVLVIALFLVIVVTLLTLPYRWITLLLARLIRPDLIDFVDTSSAYLAADNYLDRPSANIVLLQFVEGHFPLPLLRQLFYERVICAKTSDGYLKYNKLRQSFTHFMGYTFTKFDEGFDLRYHIRNYDYVEEDLWLPSPCSERDLETVLGGLLSKHWVQDRSPWEILTIQEFVGNVSQFVASKDQGHPRMVFVLRFHHALGDGYSIFYMLKEFYRAEVTVPPPTMPRYSWLFKLSAPFIFPFKLLYNMAEQLVDTYTPQSPWTLPQSIRGQGRKEFHSTFTGPIPLQTIKDIKKRFGVKFLSVTLTATSRAIARVMTQTGRTPPAQLKCVITAPLKNHPPGLTQHIAFVFTTLDLKLVCPVCTMRTISKKLDECKRSIASIGFSWILQCFQIMPMALRKIIDCYEFATIIVSTFLVPAQPLYFEGCMLSDAIDVVGPSSSRSGVVIGMCGNSGNQRISVTMDKRLITSETIFRKIGSFLEEEICVLLTHEEVCDDCNTAKK